MRNKDPLSVANRSARKNPFVEADVVNIKAESRTATVRLRNSGQEVIVNLGPIDPSSIWEGRSRLLVYVNPAGGPVIPIAVVPTRVGSLAKPDVTLGDHRGATRWAITNNFGQVVFSVDSMGNVTMGSYNAYNVASYLVDIPFVTLAPSSHLTQERVLTDGLGTYVTYDETYVYVNVFFDEPTPSTITYASTADPGVGTYAARWDHEHGIEASFDPGPAAYIVITNSNGYVAFEGLGIGAMPTSDDLHIASGAGIVHADGIAAGMFLRANGTRYVPDTLDIADITDLAYAAPNFTLTTANAIGAANTVVRSDASIAIFDAGVASTISPDDAAAAGVAAVAARRDHAHAITCDVAGNISPDDIAAEGVAYYFARSDHVHGITCAAAVAIAPDAANAEGDASSFARSNHTHQFTCAAPTTNLSATTTNAEGSGTNFVRDSHTHAITNSNNPGAAVSLLSSSAAGKLTLVDLALTSLTASTVIYADATKTIVSLANAAGYLENNGAGVLSWAAGVAPAAHDILSASHGDALADAVTDGDIIIGNVTPKWSALAISVPAANVRNVLGVDNGETRPSWKAALDGNNPATLTASAAAAAGTSLIFSHRDHVHPVTSSNNPGAAVSLLASSAAGKLTLVDLALTSLTASTVIYSNASKEIESLANAAGYLYNNGAGALSWASTAAPTAHNLLSSSHGDTTAAAVVRGDVITGQGATPKWTRLAISVPAATYRNYLGTANGDTEPGYKALFDANVPSTISPDDAAATGSAEVAARRDHTHAITCAAASAIAPDASNTEGSASSFARSDHTHQFTCAAPTTNLSATSTNTEGSGTNFVRDSHTHAITNSNNPGAAVSLLSSDASGYLTLVRLNTDTLSDKSGGDLTISPTGDIILNPTGNDILPTTNYDLTFGSQTKNFVDIHLGQVTAGLIVSPHTASGIGGRMIIAPSCLFAADLSSFTLNSAEKMTNGGFETAGGGGADVFGTWTESAGDGTITRDTTVYHGGVASCKLTSGASSNTYVYQNIAVTAGTQIIFGFWTQGDGTNAGRYRVYDVTHSGDIIAVASTGVTDDTWTKCWIDFEVPAGCASVRLYFYCPNVNAAFAYFDDSTAVTGVEITVTDDDMADCDIAYAERNAVGIGDYVEWFEIASAASGAGPYTYWVLRDLDGSGENAWYAGNGLHNTGGGNAGTEGYIEIFGGVTDSIQGTSFTTGGYILGSRRNSPAYDDVSELWLLGPNALYMLEGTYITWRDNTLGGAAVGEIYTSTAGTLTIDSGDDVVITADDDLSLTTTSTYIALDEGDSDFEVQTSADSYLTLSSAGQLSLNVDPNGITDAFMTVGLCINQDTNDDEIIALKSADVDHPMTALANTDTYGVFKKAEADSGGLAIWGYKDSAGAAGYALALSGRLGEAANTTKTIAGVGVVHIAAQITDGGTGVTSVGTDGNLVCIANSTTTRFIFDAEGSAHSDVEWTNFDEHDDINILANFEQSMGAWQDPIKEEFVSVLTENRGMLESLGLVHFDDDNPGHAMVNFTKLTMLLTGAIRQLASRIDLAEQNIALLAD